MKLNPKEKKTVYSKKDYMKRQFTITNEGDETVYLDPEFFKLVTSKDAPPLESE